MDEKGGLGFRNWDFSEQSVGVDAVLKQPVLALPVPSGSSEHQAAFLKVGSFSNRNPIISEAEASAMEFTGHYWVHQSNFLSATKGSPNQLQINTETGLPVFPTSMGIPTDGTTQNGEIGTKSTRTRKQQLPSKKANRVASKVMRTKQPKKKPSVSTKKKGKSVPTTNHEKKNLDVVIDGATLDFSQIPSPLCSCTGIPRQCYKWGAGGWQSSCCTTSLSEYPLPMSSSRPGARMAGRKMSNGAYGKLLQRLVAEGHELSNPVDLKNHWAKHGTNKFVTIK